MYIWVYVKMSRCQDGRNKVDWCSAPCRPDGLFSLDMPVQLASGLHSLGYCLSAVDPAHEKQTTKYQ